MTPDKIRIERDLRPIPPREDSSGNRVDPLFLFHAMLARWPLILLTTILGLIAAAVALHLIVPRYEARSVVMIDTRANHVLDVTAVLAALSGDQTTIQNQVQILISRSLAERVIDQLKLEDDEEEGFLSKIVDRVSDAWDNTLEAVTAPFRKKPTPAAQAEEDAAEPTPEQLARRARNDEIDHFLSGLEVTPIPLSTTMVIAYESDDPEQAALISNAIANTYVDDQLSSKFDAVRHATDWLSERVDQLADQLHTSEVAVEEYKVTHQISDKTGGGSVAEDQLTNINAQLVTARATLAEKKAIYDSVEDLQRSGGSADVSGAVTSPLISQLRDQETQIARQQAEMKSRYGPLYPKMIDLENERTNIQGKIDAEIQRIVKSVSNDVSVARANVASLESSLHEAESHMQVQGRSEVGLKSLQSSSASIRAQYEAFLSRLKATQDQENVLSADARVISPASIPDLPSYPRKKLMVAALALVGAMLGAGLAVAIEMLNPGFRRSDHAERLLFQPVLATIPEIEKLPRGPEAGFRHTLDHPLSSFSEGIRALQMGLRLGGPGRDAHVVAITSAVPDEGKTMVVTNLARLAASEGKRVVILDADLRRPAIARAMGIGGTATAFMDVVLKNRTLDECLEKDPYSDVAILACRPGLANPAAIVSSAGMEQLLDDLRRRFDLVLIDTAPVLPVNDTRAFAHMADAVVLLVRWEKTPRDSAVEAVRLLSGARTRLAGVCLSRAKFKRYLTYSFGHQPYRAYQGYHQP